MSLLNDDRPRRPLERHRGGTMYVEQRTNAWAAYVGFLIGRGRLAPQIANVLHDGTSASTIRRLIENWGIPRGPHRHAVVPVPMSAARRRMLNEEARRLHCSPEELARRLLVSIIDQGRVDETLAPPASVPDKMVARHDRGAFHEALATLSPSQYAKAVEAFPWIDLYQLPNGQIRVVLPSAVTRRDEEGVAPSKV